eukprot:SAG31_NODE_17905_length_654_cov_0.830631_1_plen_25_part_01
MGGAGCRVIAAVTCNYFVVLNLDTR